MVNETLVIVERWRELHEEILLAAADNGGEYCSDEDADMAKCIEELSRAEAQVASITAEAQGIASRLAGAVFPRQEGRSGGGMMEIRIAEDGALGFLVQINAHTDEGRNTLTPDKLKSIIGEALEDVELQEEIDYTLEVERMYVTPDDRYMTVRRELSLAEQELDAAQLREKALRDALLEAEHLCKWLLQSDIGEADRERVIRENGINFAAALALVAAERVEKEADSGR